MYLFLLLFYFIYSRAYHKHLSPNEWHSIRSLLQNKETPLQIKHKLNHILYKKHENLAERIAYQFKKLHTYKCRYISQSDLYLSAKRGLYKAITNYNTTYSFYPYVKIYIEGELYKCLTDYLPIQFTTKSNSYCSIKTNYIARIKNKDIVNKITKQQDTNKYIDYEKLYYPSSIPEYFNEWELINSSSLTPFQMRILYIKYKYFICGKKISNKKLAQYMACSEEKVRYNLKYIIRKI